MSEESKTKNQRTNESPEKGQKPSKTSSYPEINRRRRPQAIGSKPLPDIVEDCLKDMTFTLTGILDYIEREDAIKLIESCGGKVTKTLGKKCEYLIAGRNPGIKTMEKALDSKKIVLNEDQFFDLVKSKGKSMKKAMNKVIIDDVNCDEIIVKMLKIDIKVEIHRNNEIIDNKEDKKKKKIAKNKKVVTKTEQ